MKYLILLGLIFAVIMWFKFSRPNRSNQDTSEIPSQPEHMVRCAHCAVHLPEHEAITSRQAAYCSVEHRDLAEG